MNGKPKKRTICVGAKTVDLPLPQYRKVQTLLRKQRKIEAVGIIRHRVRVSLRDAKAALEDPANFDQTVGDETPTDSWLNRVRELVTDCDSPRQWLDEHRGAVAAGLTAMILLCTAFVAGGSPASAFDRNDPVIWYYDLNQQELFAASYQGSTLPATTDSAGAPGGVRAFVFSCGDCDSGAMFVGYLEKFTEQAEHARKQLDDLDSAADEQELWQQVSEGRFIRTTETDEWVLYDSPDGRHIRGRTLNRCNPNPTRACHPR